MSVKFDELRGSKPLLFDTMRSIQDPRECADISDCGFVGIFSKNYAIKSLQNKTLIRFGGYRFGVLQRVFQSLADFFRSFIY